MSSQPAGFQVVVAGEASESEDSDGEVAAIMEGGAGRGVMPDTAQKAGVVVSGEASETDDESDTEPGAEIISTDRQQQTATGEAAVESGQSQMGKLEIEKIPPKYNTLLHKKLDERNRSLKKNIKEFLSASYHHGNRTIHTSTEHLIKSKAALQDVTHNLSVIQRDLGSLQEKVDIISTCNLLPQLTVPPRHTATPPS
ncbi:biogenesis of lysosome-related organelles complex 1 subunit 3-like [Branchiostoma lanceolatum]|uniref:biogenesis of lysosome-related organelles complex 1 subunit 3-like n=1 Tax=Branchiostoma lanceolatum TaxID=7740 RepID=UPI003453A08D